NSRLRSAFEDFDRARAERREQRNSGEVMNCLEKFRIPMGAVVKLADFDPKFSDEDEDKSGSRLKLNELRREIADVQYRLYAETKRSLLICLQAPDVGGKDGVVRHVIASMNPQGCRVVGFKQPTPEALAHDFLWRIERQTPKRGEVVAFNRSRYEDVLVARLHDLVPKEAWQKRYDQINDFERRLVANDTHILKLFLHISKDEQLERFKRRLDDPDRNWKISEADYAERKYWDDYEVAYEAVHSRCSTADAPWFVIPSDHKWFRNLAVARIIAKTMRDLGIEVPESTVDFEDIRKKYHHAEQRRKEANVHPDGESGAPR
ncbi:MAG: PPK2 family polyphosphate kinase, partial [Polyangiaceae bacterium]